MADIDINLFYNTYRLEAMERVLHSQGKSIEDAVYPMLDSLYEQLVPAVERGDIENRIAAENAQAAAEAEAAKRFGVVHLHQGEDDFYLIANEQRNLYTMAALYRRQLQPNIGKVSLWDLTGRFHKADRVFQSDYLRLCRQMPTDHRITSLMEVDFDSGTICVCDNRENSWTTYSLKDVSTAVFKAERKSGLSSAVRQQIFDEALQGKTIATVHQDEDLEDGEGISEDEDPEEAEEPEPVMRM